MFRIASLVEWSGWENESLPNIRKPESRKSWEDLLGDFYRRYQCNLSQSQVSHGICVNWFRPENQAVLQTGSAWRAPSMKNQLSLTFFVFVLSLSLKTRPKIRFFSFLHLSIRFFWSHEPVQLFFSIRVHPLWWWKFVNFQVEIYTFATTLLLWTKVLLNYPALPFPFLYSDIMRLLSMLYRVE